MEQRQLVEQRRQQVRHKPRSRPQAQPQRRGGGQAVLVIAFLAVILLGGSSQGLWSPKPVLVEGPVVEVEAPGSAVKPAGFRPVQREVVEINFKTTPLVEPAVRFEPDLEFVNLEVQVREQESPEEKLAAAEAPEPELLQVWVKVLVQSAFTADENQVQAATAWLRTNDPGRAEKLATEFRQTAGEVLEWDIPDWRLSLNMAKTAGLLGMPETELRPLAQAIAQAKVAEELAVEATLAVARATPGPEVVVQPAIAPVIIEAPVDQAGEKVAEAPVQKPAAAAQPAEQAQAQEQVVIVDEGLLEEVQQQEEQGRRNEKRGGRPPWLLGPVRFGLGWFPDDLLRASLSSYRQLLHVAMGLGASPETVYQVVSIGPLTDELKVPPAVRRIGEPIANRILVIRLRQISGPLAPRDDVWIIWCHLGIGPPWQVGETFDYHYLVEDWVPLIWEAAGEAGAAIDRGNEKLGETLFPQ